MYGCRRSAAVPNSTASTCSHVSALDCRPGRPAGQAARVLPTVRPRRRKATQS